MKNTQLSELLGAIDDELIEKSVKRRNRRSIKRHFGIGIGTVAACAVLAVSALFIGGFFTEEPTQPPTPGTESIKLTDTPTTALPAVMYGDFVIKDGVLMEYTGRDTEVTLPGEVESVAANAFCNSEVAGSITIIKLGANVSQIDERAFAGLSALEAVEVPEDNGSFVFADGILMATDGTIHFSTTSEGKVDMNKFRDTLTSMAGHVDFKGKRAVFVFGDLTVTAKNKYHKNVPTATYFELESFSIFGKEFNLSESKYGAEGTFDGSTLIHFDIREDMFMFTRKGQTWGYYLIITKDNIYEISTPDAEAEPDVPWYNQSVYVYYLDEAGILRYSRTPTKFVPNDTAEWELRYCVALDEFGDERGYATLENGEVVHHPEEYYTVSEYISRSYGLDKNGNRHSLYTFFEAFYYNEDGTKRDIPQWSLPPADTLEELLQYNREHYERAK